MILNKGITKTALIDPFSTFNSNNIIKNEIAWNADYDGKLANLSVNINNNGKKKYIDMKLTNDDLSKLLSIPSENKALDKRLSMDFNQRFMSAPEDFNNQKIIIIPSLKKQISDKPLIMPLSLNKKSRKYSKNLKSKTKSKSKSKSKSKKISYKEK